MAVLAVITPSAGGETLGEAWRAAIRANPGLDAERQKLEAAEARLDSARAARLPTAEVWAAYTVLDEPPRTVFDLPVPGTPPVVLALRDDFVIANASLTLPIYAGGRISGGIDAAELAVDAGERQLGAARAALRLEVAGAFLNVLRAARAEQSARASVDARSAHREVVVDLLTEGVVARHDLLRAEVAVADGRLRLAAAENARSLAEAGYNRLLDRELGSPVDLEPPALPAVTGDLDGLVEAAVRRRAELDRLEAEVQVLRQRADIRRGDVRPQLGVGAAYSYLENDVLEEEAYLSASVIARWKMFDGGRTLAEAQVLEHRADAVERRRQDAASAIRLEVRSAWDDLEESRHRLDLARTALELALEELEVARDRYRNGVGTGAEVLDAEARVVRGRSQRDDARFDLLEARVRLDRATGVLEDGAGGWS